MNFIKKMIFLFIFVTPFLLIFTQGIQAENNENHIIIHDNEIEFKYTDMINLDFIKFISPENRIKKDIVYKKNKDYSLKLDLIFPEIKLQKKYPVVLYIHGGGFIRGDKDEVYSLKPLVDEWLENGWAVISVNYRLLYGHTMFPDNYNDVIDAIDWIIDNKNKYNFSSEISVIGHSAGGCLALLSSFKHEEVDCVVSLSGPTKLYGKDTFELRKKMMEFINQNNFSDKLMKEASPVTHIKSDSPPILLIHGTIDNFVPYNQSEILYNKAQQIGANCKFITIEGGGHILEMSYLPRMDQLKERIVEFMEKNIN